MVAGIQLTKSDNGNVQTGFDPVLAFGIRMNQDRSADVSDVFARDFQGRCQGENIFIGIEIPGYHAALSPFSGMHSSAERYQGYAFVTADPGGSLANYFS